MKQDYELTLNELGNKNHFSGVKLDKVEGYLLIEINDDQPTPTVSFAEQTNGGTKIIVKGGKPGSKCTVRLVWTD